MYLERDMVDQLAVTSVEEYVTEIVVRIVHEKTGLIKKYKTGYFKQSRFWN